MTMGRMRYYNVGSAVAPVPAPAAGSPTSVVQGGSQVPQLGALPTFNYEFGPPGVPGTATGVPTAGWAGDTRPQSTTGGWASAPIDSYMRNLQGFEIGRGGVTASGQPQYQTFKTQQPVIQQPVPPVPPVVTPPGRDSRGPTTGGVPVIGGSTLGDPSKIPTSVPGNEGAWLNVGVPGQEWSRKNCLLYTSPSPRDRQKSRMPSSA